MILIYLDAAINDLAEHWNYYFESRSESTANRVVTGIQTTCELLRNNGLIGRSRAELKTDLRSYSIRKHVIYYMVDEAAGEVVVVRILHGARDIAGLSFLPGNTPSQISA